MKGLVGLSARRVRHYDYRIVDNNRQFTIDLIKILLNNKPRYYYPSYVLLSTGDPIYPLSYPPSPNAAC